MVNRVSDSTSFVAPTAKSKSTPVEIPIRVVESSEIIEFVSNESSQDQPQLSKEKAEKLVDSMNEFLSSTKTSLKFQFHEKLSEYYVTIVDTKTEDIVREIPSKKLMDTYAAMMEFVGVLVDRKI